MPGHNQTCRDPGTPKCEAYVSYINGSPLKEVRRPYSSSFICRKEKPQRYIDPCSTDVTMASSSHFLHGQALPQSPTELSPPLRNGMGISSDNPVSISSFCQDDWGGDQVLWRSLPTTVGVGSVLDASHNLLEDDFGGTASLGVGMSASYYGGDRKSVV